MSKLRHSSGEPNCPYIEQIHSFVSFSSHFQSRSPRSESFTDERRAPTRAKGMRYYSRFKVKKLLDKVSGPTCPFMSTVSGETPAHSCVKAPLGGGELKSPCFKVRRASFRDHQTDQNWYHPSREMPLQASDRISRIETRGHDTTVTISLGELVGEEDNPLSSIHHYQSQVNYSLIQLTSLLARYMLLVPISFRRGTSLRASKWIVSVKI